MTRILTEEERNAIKAKLPEPRNNKLWKNYLQTGAKRIDRIGEIIIFARYGDIPEDGMSVTYITLAPPYKAYPKLAGLSVFEVVDGKEIHPMKYPDDLFARPKIMGKGIIIGWGTDGEPLVKVFSIF